VPSRERHRAAGWRRTDRAAYLPDQMGKVTAIVFLLALNAFFVATEFALVRARRTRLEAMVRRGDPFAKLALRAVDNLSRMLSASQLGITLASLGLGYVAEASLEPTIHGWLEHLPWAIETGVRGSIVVGVALTIATYLHVVLGELYPRALALNYPETFAKWLAPPLLLFTWVFTPLIFAFDRSNRVLLRLTRQNPNVREDQVHEVDEIRLILEQSHEEGKIEAKPAGMLDAVFEFTEKKARDVMTPRTKMVALQANSTFDGVLTTVEETAFSRYPVYESSLDEIIGVVLAKDMLPALRRDRADFDLRRLMRSAHFVPGSREVEEVLSDFKRTKSHLAIVLDEYGGTAGLVTMEDLLEELVGEILDEHDEAMAAARGTGDDVVLDGTTAISDVNERVGLTVPDEEYATIGGFVFGALGRLPVVGDRVAAGGAQLVVRAMEGRRIAEVTIQKTRRREDEKTRQDSAG
jgi:CBS domain containing-hemolysin-like protein